MSLTIEVDEATYPAKYVVCWQCKGKGTSTAYLGAYSGQELYELGPEFMEDYSNGVYDRECDTCRGRTTVLVPDEDRLTEEQKTELDRYYRMMSDLYAMEAAERRMGC